MQVVNYFPSLFFTKSIFSALSLDVFSAALSGTISRAVALSNVFKCLICMGTTADARMCPNCSKLFCFGCIRRWITQIKAECPHCRSYLGLDTLINCRFADDVVQQLNSLKFDVKASRSFDNADMFCRCDAHHECLTVFCSTCDHAICHKCALFDGRHGDHNFRPLDEVYKEHLEVVKNEMGILSDRRREIQALLKEIVRNTNTLNLKKENRVEEIKSYFEALLFRLESTHRKKFSALNAQHGHLKQEEELLTSLLSEVESQLKVISPSNLINRSSALSSMFSEVHNTPMPKLNVDPSTYDLPSELFPQLSAGEFIIENFSQVRQQVEPLYSPPLERDGVAWRLKVYPNGNGAVRGEYLSVFLEMTTGRSEASTYEYSIQLVHQGPPSVNSKCITREFASDFAVGECWGYNRFIQVSLLEAEDYISRMNDTLRFKYMVRPQSYEVQCRDLHWKIEQLEQEKLQLKEKVRALESSSSQNGNQKRPFSPPSASGRRAGENGDRSSSADDDEHDNDSPRDSPGEVGLKRQRPNLPKPSEQVPSASNPQPFHTNDQVIDDEEDDDDEIHTPQLIDSFESDDNEANGIDISSSSTSTDGLRLESYLIEDYEEGEGEERAQFSPHVGEEDEDLEQSFPIFSNTDQDMRQSYRRVASLDQQHREYLDRVLQRLSSRAQENAPVDAQGNGQSDETFYELLRRLQDRRPMRSRSDFTSEDAYLEYLLTSPQGVESYLGGRRSNQRRRPTSAFYLPQSPVFRPRSSNERITGRLEPDLFQSVNPLPSNGEPITNRSSPIGIHVISSPASSLSASTRMNLEVIRRRMRELAEQTPSMSTTAEIERELRQSLPSNNEMNSASLQADADEIND
ncbi:unnamed protein product [Hymenolepis diminuta]|uniref:RING-type domain-containing protein n=1 Tax=Hymenolepis diminuta TaxID=6216 RepID=A0A158QF55_HYMDI|nr:unnamed protein product [Hymenolepis diminuta]